MSNDSTPLPRIRLGISTCLLGERVRYDGGHKLDRWIVNTLGQYVDFVPVCPEVECGLPVPREAMRLVGDPDAPRLQTIRSHRDLTEQMLSWAERRIDELQRENLSGFVFKSKSPSSGMERVKIYNEKGNPHGVGSGLFAKAFMDRFPLMPVEDDGRLHDAILRENFIARIFVYRRWRELVAAGPTRKALVEFHTRHKLLIMSHDEKLMRQMGKLVADPEAHTPEDLFEQYRQLLLTALEHKATVRRHVNVLQHILGYFKDKLSADEKQETLETLDAYRQGHVPLIVPVTLLNHYVRKFGQPYLKEQFYLHPHPLELQLRNHV